MMAIIRQINWVSEKSCILVPIADVHVEGVGVWSKVRRNPRTFAGGGVKKIYFIVSNRLKIVSLRLAPQFTQLEFDEAKGDDAQ